VAPIFWRLIGFAVLSTAMAPSAISEASSRKSQNLTRDDILAQGLKIWRKPGAIDGGAACATCHSPDGIDLAAYNFDDQDIARRANPHVGYADAHLLVEYFHALRTKLKLSPLRDPIRDRPLQPGGEVLPGDTPAARDLAFGKELQSKLPLLFGPRIETMDQARAAEAELLTLNPAKLKIGIPLNRLSEDQAHGDEHASIAQWLPEVPPNVPKDKLPQWYAAEDKYLADPSQANLRQLLLDHGKLINTNVMVGIDAISVLKFRGLLVLQDRIRNNTETQETGLSGDLAYYPDDNSFWNVGDLTRDVIRSDPQRLGMDKLTQSKKSGSIPLAQQLHQLRVSWFWLAWLSDQGLFMTSHDDKVRLGMWLSQSLSEDGPYPIHNVYANARRQAVVSNELTSWGEPKVRWRRIWDFAGLRSFGYQSRDLPQDPDYRQLTIAFTANCFRMNLQLLKKEILDTHAVWVKQSARANVKELAAFLTRYDPDDSANTAALSAELSKLIDGAKERNDFNPQIPLKSG